MPKSNVIPFRPRRQHWLVVYRRYWEQSLDRLETYVAKLSEGDALMESLKLIAPKDEPIITGAARVFDAPRALVWRCFSEPSHIARWWGPRSIGALSVKQLDFRVGGKWRFEHALERGPVIAFTGSYLVIEPISRIVNTFGVEGMYGGAELEETHLLEEREGKTAYTSVLRFDDLASRDAMLASGMEKGAAESMAQLESLLADLQEATVE
jgi:uncharacterized protein YndB with AHSA1/START domain